MIGGNAQVDTHPLLTSLSRACVLTIAAAVGVPGLAATPGAAAHASAPDAQAQAADTAGQEQSFKRKQEERRQFQGQELITARPFSFIFNSGDPPRIVWRDVDEVRRLGSDARLRVRWFDADRNEVAKPARPGRWGALIEGVAPNGTPVRRAMTFYCRPPGFLLYFPPDPADAPSHLPGPIAPDVWREHRDEFSRLSKDSLLKALNDSEAGVTLIAGLSGARPLGRTPLTTETAAVLNEDYHLALKLEVLGLRDKVRPLKPPRERTTPAPSLHEGTAARAGMRPEAASKIRAVCAAWAEDSGEPFVTLVAQHGVIVVHEAFGRDGDGRPVGLDYRCDVASITKTVTAILFSRFLDQGLIGLDDSVATLFPDYPRDDAHVPTFRQCLTHMSGLSGHGDWGGVRNPHLENVILNAIDVNEPGKAYAYSGMGFDLTAKAMEIVAGKGALHLYREHLYRPLGMGDVPMENASAGARFTARELGILAQWLANRGSYGGMELHLPADVRATAPGTAGPALPRRKGGGRDRHALDAANPARGRGRFDPSRGPDPRGARPRARFAFVVHLPRRPRTGARRRPGPEDGRSALRRVVAEILPGDRGRRDAVGRGHLIARPLRHSFPGLDRPEARRGACQGSRSGR